MPPENSNKSRRLMHTRSITCEGFLRDDGLWEVEAWLRDTKPLHPARQPFSRRTEAGRSRARYRPAARDRRDHDHPRGGSHDARHALPDLHRCRADPGAPGRRAHRSRLARSGPAQDRPAGDLHAPDGIARPRRDHAVPDHVPRQETGGPRLRWRISRTPAGGRSSSAAAIPGAPTARWWRRCSRSLRPSRRRKIRRARERDHRPRTPPPARSRR